jgi:hypothetical protein
MFEKKDGMVFTGLMSLRTGATGLILEARSVIFGFHSMRAIRDWLRTIVAQNSAPLISYIRVPSMCFSLLWELGTTLNFL